MTFLCRAWRSSLAPIYTLIAVAFVAACAQTSEPPAAHAPAASTQSEVESDASRVITKRRRLALRLQEAGDLRGAEMQWHIVTVIAPQEPAFREAWEAAQAARARAVADEFKAATAALRKGETETGVQTMLRVLALEPDHAEAARHLRSVEHHRIGKFQTDRAARLRPEFIALMNRAALANRKPQHDPNNGYDLDQSVELLRTGNEATALAELRRLLDASPRPTDKTLRRRVAGEVQQRAAELDTQGDREQALNLYEHAIAFRGDAPPTWHARVQALKKSIAADAFEKGQRAYKTDLALAIKYWETSLRHDPNNSTTELRLQEARRLYRKLQQIEKGRHSAIENR